MLYRLILKLLNRPLLSGLTVSAALAFGLLIMSGGAFAGSGNPRVGIMTSKGPIVIEVFLNATPMHARNFLDLVERGFYNGLTFHRVENWVVQGGCPRGDGTGNFVDPQTGRPRFLPLEIDRRLSHRRVGAVAMARSASPDSASCQFYFLKRSMPQLDGKYTIFGHVLKGMNTVYHIQRGDRIMYAKVLSGSGSSAGSGGSGNPQPLVPPDYSGGPEDIEDSGF